MKLTDLNTKTAIHCQTQEEFDRINETVAEYLDKDNMPNDCFEQDKNTVIYLDCQYGCLEYARQNGYTIIKSTEVTP